MVGIKLDTCQAELILQLRECTDEELVELARTHPEEGRYLLCLYCRYQSLVESLVASSQQAPVMAATVWVQVRSKLTTLNIQERKFLSWLTVLSADTLTQVLRGNQKLLTSASTANPVTLAYVDQALQQLSPPERFMVIFHDVYQWPLAQIRSWLTEQQWTVPASQLTLYLQQAHQRLLANLPPDLKTLCWQAQSPEEQLRTALQGLEFDPELERERYHQWHQQGQPITTRPQGIWVAGILTLVGLGGFLAWQGVTNLSANLAAPPIQTVPKPVPIAPVVADRGPDTSERASVTPTTPVEPARVPTTNLPKPNNLSVLVKPVATAAVIVPAKPQSVTPASTKPTLAKVVVVASSPAQVAQLRRQFPASFPKICAENQCIQVGAFKTSDNAEELAAQLRARGYEVNVIAPT
ncbi:SPOR domain-containing protein [Candidatus Cyanaurora vandensis]|uniref:SPOR domain-containing protein n=1 Tax=Candidatus Cyanaurora vandensis TaxID=2714958 RepID=UPI00257D470E|nr:SPOR domain-containing protein [Candidatus Cyanaurora vandensis]